MCYLDSGNKEECTGCSLCAQVCNHQAITMIEDEDGFLYPKINTDRCVSCGLCMKSCTANNDSFNKAIECYAAVCQDKNVLLNSASGGAFYSIVASCSNETDIYGATWIDRSNVAHKKATKCDAYELFRKSKYVQSDIRETYRQVKSSLVDGKKVIYIGTPCQIAGIKSYVGKNNGNLILVDLICHGVSSHSILEECLQCFDHNSDKVTGVTFRHKEKRKGKWQSKLIKMSYQSGKEKILDYDSCGFLRGYDNGLLLRPSCYKCKYAGCDRESDITIGDFWGGEQYGYDPHYGTSLVIVNTLKGKNLLDEMAQFLNLERIDYSYAIEHNACLRGHSLANPKREQTLRRIKVESFEKVMQEVIPPIPKWKKIAHDIKTNFRRKA